MSYYILPKNNHFIDINPIINSTDVKVQTSHSIYNYYNETIQQLIHLSKEDLHLDYSDLLKEINPCEYIYSKVPGSKYSVSKLKTKTNIFYDFYEIYHCMNVFESFKNVSIQSLYISLNFTDIMDCIDILRENKKDKQLCYPSICDINNEVIHDEKFDFLFYEIEDEKLNDLNDYIISFIEIIRLLIQHQKMNGNCVIKINHLFYKPIIDLLYILCSFYEKTYIIKPSTSNIILFDKYIVCKNFLLLNQSFEIYNLYESKFSQVIQYYTDMKTNNSHPKQNIISIIDYQLPSLFINKIDDINIIIGQQQLEAIDQFINLFKNKNKNEKIEYIRKNNIQKAVHWCEKFKIPYNKFLEKTNIFLPIIKDDNMIQDSIMNFDVENENIINDSLNHLIGIIDAKIIDPLFLYDNYKMMEEEYYINGSTGDCSK